LISYRANFSLSAMELRPYFLYTATTSEEAGV
jgi:hypothetical protein